MPPVLRLLKLAFGTIVGLLVVWFEAVRRTPEVKARKAVRRRNRRPLLP